MVQLSGQQFAIKSEVRHGSRNIVVVARAGTGKTFMIIQSIKDVQAERRDLTVGVGAFNTKIAKEMNAKSIDAGLRADVATFHSFGYRAIRTMKPNAKKEGVKRGEAGYTKFARIAEELNIPKHMHSLTKKAMGLAMQRGFGITIKLNDPTEWLKLAEHYGLDEEINQESVQVQLRGKEAVLREGLQFACKAIKRGIELSDEVYSFDDMLYLPIYYNAGLPKFDIFATDEAQDSNALRRLMAVAMTKPNGRRIWVGDDCQAINGFCGADNDALDIIQRNDNAVRLYMTQTFRCGKAIVEAAKQLVPDYVAADTNPAGKVSEMPREQFLNTALSPDDLILCRNTRPLVEAAHSLIKKGVACRVEGKEIGKDLMKLIDRFPEATTLAALSDRLSIYEGEELARLTASGKETLAEAISDRVETLHAVIESMAAGASIGLLRKQIEDLFADTPDGEPRKVVTLMTIHKSKGLESKRVFHLGRVAFLPSKRAQSDWAKVQERNLEYVAYTRAIEEYVDVAG